MKKNLLLFFLLLFFHQLQAQNLEPADCIKAYKDALQVVIFSENQHDYTSNLKKLLTSTEIMTNHKYREFSDDVTFFYGGIGATAKPDLKNGR